MSKKNIVYRPSQFDSRRRSDAEAARLLFGEEKHFRNILEQFDFNLIEKYAVKSNFRKNVIIMLILNILLILYA